MHTRVPFLAAAGAPEQGSGHHVMRPPCATPFSPTAQWHQHTQFKARNPTREFDRPSFTGNERPRQHNVYQRKWCDITKTPTLGASTMAPTLHEPRTCNGTMTGRYHSMYPFGGLPAATKTRSASLRSEMQPPHERQKDTWKSAAFAMAPHTQRHHPQTSAIEYTRSS